MCWCIYKPQYQGHCTANVSKPCFINIHDPVSYQHPPVQGAPIIMLLIVSLATIQGTNCHFCCCNSQLIRNTSLRSKVSSPLSTDMVAARFFKNVSLHPVLCWRLDGFPFVLNKVSFFILCFGNFTWVTREVTPYLDPNRQWGVPLSFWQAQRVVLIFMGSITLM